MKLLQLLSYQLMCKSLSENDNRAQSEPFTNMMGTFTWERRYFGQSFSDDNDLLRSSTDILIWDLGNAIFCKNFKESLEGCNNSVTDSEHFIKRNLDISHSTLFVEIQLIKLLVRGSGAKYVIFYMAPIPLLSVLIYSKRSQYVILKVSLKKIEQNLPVGCIKH